jgi:hypothetical protein
LNLVSPACGHDGGGYAQFTSLDAPRAGVAAETAMNFADKSRACARGGIALFAMHNFG